MYSLFTNNVFSSEDIEYLLTHPSVLKAKEILANNHQTLFHIPLTETIRVALGTLGLDLSSVSDIPMRWIAGDTAPHKDVGSTKFENTYLVYVSNSPGEFLLDSTSYPIVANTGFVFKEGVVHQTLNTGTAPRLLVGPMNEFAKPVGATMTYYPTLNDALNYTNALYYGGSYTIDTISGFSDWYVASNSSGTYDTLTIYHAGNELPSTGSYNLYPSLGPLCFAEGTRVLTQNGYKAVETLLTKDLIVTSDTRVVDFSLKKISLASTNKASAPYRIEAGAFGAMKPSADICLSPLHKIQIRKGVWISPERAALTNPKVKQYGVGEPVTYWHIACDDYLKDNLVCEGMVVESLATNKNYDGPVKVYAWSERLGGFTRRSAGASVVARV